MIFHVSSASLIFHSNIPSTHSNNSLLLYFNFFSIYLLAISCKSSLCKSRVKQLFTSIDEIKCIGAVKKFSSLLQSGTSFSACMKKFWLEHWFRPVQLRIWWNFSWNTSLGRYSSEFEAKLSLSMQASSFKLWISLLIFLFLVFNTFIPSFLLTGPERPYRPECRNLGWNTGSGRYSWVFGAHFGPNQPETENEKIK